jgi:hypothetical protein
MRVALASCAPLPHPDGDEPLLLAALERRGIDAHTFAWDGGDRPFLDAELTVIRSTWDYAARLDAFLQWVERIEVGKAGRGHLCNPARVVRWNTHKRYLNDLDSQGVATVPTVLLKAGSRADVRQLLVQHGFTRGAVVKPCVSAGARDTVLIDALNVDEAQGLTDRLLPTRDLMLQPFVAGIAQGELSLHFIDGQFTHAVRKVPRAGDFRSQPEFGATVSRVEPDAAARAVATRALHITGGDLLYARVDLLPADAGAASPWWLIELELVEPSMYLPWHAPAADLFAAAIERRARTQQQTERA